MEQYQVNIEQFEGPLDLLLHLIQQAEIDICDIFVSESTSQYLAYLEQFESVDMDRASEFLTMAATLVYIKSRQLLPRPPKETEEGEEEDPEAVLIRQLRDYKAFKEAGAALQEKFMEARESLTRLPEDVPLPPQKVDLSGATMDKLYAAFLSILERAEIAEKNAKLHRVRPDNFTVRSQLGKIRGMLRDTNDTLRFEELFSEDAGKMEIIVTFMALLEMISHGEIHLKQSEPYAPITIWQKRLLDEDADYAYMDELTDEEEKE